MPVKKPIEFNRRHFLKGVGGITVAIPFLDSLSENAYAQTMDQKDNFVAIKTSSGFLKENWYTDPQRINYVQRAPFIKEAPLTGISGAFSDIIGSEWNDYKSDMLILRGIFSSRAGGHSHQKVLTGHGETHLGSGKYITNVNSSPSIDEIIATTPGFYQATPVTRGLHFTIQRWPDPSGISYSRSGGQTQLNVPFDRPHKAFEALFKNVGTGNTSQQELQLISRKKVIDLILGQFRQIASSTRISKSNRDVLNAYGDQLSELENRMRSNIQITGSCTQPGNIVNSYSYNQLEKGNQAVYEQVMSNVFDNYFDMIAIAFQCGMSKTATLLVDDGVHYTWLPGVSSDHHAYTHGSYPLQLSGIGKWLGKNLAKLLVKLDVPAVNSQGRLLDKTLVFYTNELGTESPDHSHYDLPIILAGGGGKHFKMNRIVNYLSDKFVYGTTSGQLGRPYNQLLVTILKSYGVSTAQIESYTGEQGFGTYDFHERVFQHLNNDLGKREPLPFINS